MSPSDYEVPAAIQSHPAWHRLEEQLGWYSKNSTRLKRIYKLIKLLLIIFAATVPALALLDLRYVVAAVGVVIAVLESLLLLNQYGSLWISYRGTAESLKRERWLLLARAGVYKGHSDEDALRKLADRVEAILTAEHGSWTEDQQKLMAQPANPPTAARQ